MSAPNDPLAPPPRPRHPRPPPPPPVSYAPPPPASYAPPPTYVPPPPPKKKKTWLIVLAVIVSLILLLIIGCSVLFFGAYSYGKSHMAITPETALVVLHSHMTKGEAPAIYAESDAAYKEAVTEAQSDAMFNQIHNALGDPIKTQIVEKKGSELGGQDVEELTVLTTFTKGSANETIQYRKGADDQYHLIHYAADSDNLR